MAGKRKGAGGNLNRTQVVTVRLDPKLKYSAELAARIQRRTLSSFVEWSVEEAVKKVEVMGIDHAPTSVDKATRYVWDVNEADRLVKLALHFPELLTFDEDRLWKIIIEHPYFWYQDWENEGGWLLSEDFVNFKHLRDQWETLNKILDGEATIQDIPKTEKHDDTSF
jgi:hypothetical protein